MAAIDSVVVVIASLALLRAILKGQASFSNPLMWFFLGSAVFVNLGAIRDTWFGPVHDARAEIYFHLLELVHLGAVAAGYWWGIRIVSRAARRRLPEGGQARARTRILARFAALLAASALLKVYVIQAEPLLRGETNELSNYVRLFGLAAVGVGPLAVAVFEEHRSRLQGLRRAAFAFLAAAVALLWSLDFSRTPVGYGLFVLFCWIVWRAQVHRSSVFRRVAVVYAMPLMAVVALAAGGSVKGFSSLVLFGIGADQAIIVAIEHVSRLEFLDAYDNGLFALETYPRVTPYLYGESLGSVLLAFIPRSLWPGKPYGFSYSLTRDKLGQQAVESGHSLASSLLGDMWAGGGLPNVVLLSLATGWIFAWVRQWHDRNADMAARVIYWQFLFMALILPRGDIYTILVRGLEILTFSLAARWVVWGRSPARWSPSPRVHVRGRGWFHGISRSVA